MVSQTLEQTLGEKLPQNIQPVDFFYQCLAGFDQRAFEPTRNEPILDSSHVIEMTKAICDNIPGKEDFVLETFTNDYDDKDILKHIDDFYISKGFKPKKEFDNFSGNITRSYFNKDNVFYAVTATSMMIEAGNPSRGKMIRVTSYVGPISFVQKE